MLLFSCFRILHIFTFLFSILSLTIFIKTWAKLKKKSFSCLLKPAHAYYHLYWWRFSHTKRSIAKLWSTGNNTHPCINFVKLKLSFIIRIMTDLQNNHRRIIQSIQIQTKIQTTSQSGIRRIRHNRLGIPLSHHHR